MQQHIHDSKRGEIIATNVVCGVAANLIVALRFVSRKFSNAGYGLDDWLIVTSLVI